MVAVYRTRYSREPPQPRNPQLPTMYRSPFFSRVHDFSPRKLARGRAILGFQLKLTPKNAYEWVSARIRASQDCTVPSSMHQGFEEHTVPYYFSRNGANYEIWADHYDVRAKGKGSRLRRNRHVGNVYASELFYDGQPVLYVSAIQLANPYRTDLNAWVGSALIRGLRNLAEQRGYSSLWLNEDLLSHFSPLADAALREAERMGGRSFVPPVNRIDYLDLPARHYAAPHTGHVREILLR